MEESQKESMLTQNPSSGAGDIMGGSLDGNLLELMSSTVLEAEKAHFQCGSGSRAEEERRNDMAQGE